MSELAERLKSHNRFLLRKTLPLKYEGMAENEFRFFRGTCHLFYEDMANVPLSFSSPLTWICGDLHLENFGSYKAENGLVYFDLNDFDEAVKAPAAWELARMVTSILVAFEVLGIEQKQALSMARLYLKSYAETLVKGKAFNIEPRTAKGIVCDFLTGAEHNGQKVILHKRTETQKKKVVLSLENERHLKLKKKMRRKLCEHVQQWINGSSESPYNYKVVDAVFRVAGTGSIGVRRYLFLLKSTNVKRKYLLLDMKQSGPSSLLPYLKEGQPSWHREADRIVQIQQRMQYMSASLLTTTVFKGRSYVLQELQPVKDSIKFKLIKDRYRDMYRVIDDMAMLTASAQLRSSGMNGTATIDELRKFGSSPDWQEVLLNYAIAYTGRVKADYRQFVHDYRNGVFAG